ncbi:Glycosyltransferase involved in cell wall bisynthesis [Salinimicrobium sediminis]|uniref:Glycosyltransferase involved in cell wall bisynthesis n=1 Tax=Salinimicrobium sediminis TaxID=1343891 RepID=A0A285X4N7_9FLAO|nr:glycosyltransferase family 4 protein [Salinimicrobium sediminis]SOC80313.1 Glycosyltransferase involved in cell wall bisynthesis [Salinimicrobium sediminis]
MFLKLIRITTIPLSLEKLLEGQLTFMNEYFKVTAVAAEKERLEKYGRDNGVETFQLEMTREITPAKDLRALFKLYRFLKREKPAIVHTHTPKAGIVGMMAAKMAGVPVRLHTVAGMPLMETIGAKRKILEQVERLTYRLATKVYPNSEGLKKIILSHNFTKPGKLKVLGEGSSNGIDTGYFSPADFTAEQKQEIRQSLNIPSDDLVFIFVGRLVRDKGINELVQAFKQLASETKDISLLLVGPFEQELDPIKEENLREIKAHSKIFTTGYQVDVRPYFAAADVLVFPSYREGFPNVVMQAGAMGLPSIVTDINGCNEIIREEENGLIIPVKDQEALLLAMKKLATNAELRRKLAANSRSVITEKYERKVFWGLLLEEYKLQMKEAGL